MATPQEVQGMVVEVNAVAGTLRLKEDEEHFCGLACSGNTIVVGDEGERHLADLQAGDYIRSECLREDDGRLVATKIAVLRPAWRMLESPET